MTFLSPRQLVRRSFYLPWAPIPDGRMLELPDRGSTYVTDTPGPRPDSPTILLLHALGCTGLLALVGAVVDLRVDEFALVAHLHTTLEPLFLDTGPPKALTFAELILHRSLLAHAPPARV